MFKSLAQWVKFEFGSVLGQEWLTPGPRDKSLGQAKVHVDMNSVEVRRANGESLRAIARDLGVSPALLVKRAKASK